MTEHEDLIARLRNSSGVQAADVNERVALMDEAADALEKVTVERDNWKLSAEEAERAEQRAEKRAEEAERERDRLDDAFDRDLPWRYAEVEAQRNQLAAVVEQVRKEAEAYGKQPDVMEPCGAVAQSLQWILATAPSVALDRVKAEALREAADDYVESGREQSFGVTSVLMFLYDRADGIEKGEGND